MNAERLAIAAAHLEASREHDAGHEDRLARFRNVEEDSAALLGVLVRAAGAKRILELGTSNGYSTLWLADAAEAVGATVSSVEVDAERTELAREVLGRAGLAAELRVEDAAQTLAAGADEAWDLIFLDAERPAYASYWPDLLRVLAPGGLLAIDNVLSHAEQVAEVTALIEAEPTVTTTLVPVGAGLRMVVRSR